ncbi:MAG: VWA domain-containing protein [Myxococcota bacterium]|nr:VWA domain-containing protein [Myxococcota bacterium]
MILITDGEDHEGDPMEAAKLAESLGIRVFTIGVGTAQGRPVPVIDEEGRVIGTMKAPDGKTPLFSELNEGLLREIATLTDGAYYHLGPTGMGDGLVAAIDALEKQEYEATFRHLRDDRFQLALAPAVVLLRLESLLAGLWRRRRS